MFSIRGLRLYFPALEPWVTPSALLPTVCPGLFVSECGAAGCYPPALPAPFSATLSPALLVYLCANAGPQGLLVVRLPALFIPDSASLVPTRPRESSPPWCSSLPLLPVWMDVSFLSTCCRISLLFNFLSVLVVRGGAVCLPTLPSWFSPPQSFSVFLPTPPVLPMAAHSTLDAAPTLCLSNCPQ